MERIHTTLLGPAGKKSRSLKKKQHKLLSTAVLQTLRKQKQVYKVPNREPQDLQNVKSVTRQ